MKLYIAYVYGQAFAAALEKESLDSVVKDVEESEGIAEVTITEHEADCGVFHID